jgi:hypothetical protein
LQVAVAPSDTPKKAKHARPRRITAAMEMVLVISLPLVALVVIVAIILCILCR